MGAAQTKNTANAVMEAVARTTTDIYNKSENSTAQQQLIEIKDVKGDVTISGNKFDQNAKINTENLLRALTNTQQQQELAQSISQSAESLVSGINLGQYSSAENITNAFMSASMEITTNIGQVCEGKLAQNQTLNVEQVGGNFKLTENSFNQVADIFAKCIADVTSNNTQVQKLDQELSQKAVAKTEGISPWALFGIIAAIAVIVALVVLGPAALLAGKIMALIATFFFPILAITGIGLLVYYFTSQQTEMVSTQFSMGLQNAKACGAQDPYTPTTIYNNYYDAGFACKNDSECQGLDWFPATDASGTNPKTVFFKTVTDPNPTTCNPSVSADQTQKNTSSTTLILRPTLFSGTTAPTANLPNQRENDMYLNTVTGDMYKSVAKYDYTTSPATVTVEWKRDNGVIKPVYNIYNQYPAIKKDTPITLIDAKEQSISNKTFKDANGNNIEGYIIVYNDLYTGFKVFKQTVEKTEAVIGDASGGLVLIASAVPNSPKPTQTIWSGTKYVIKNNALLISGIVLLIVGIIGTIVSVILYIQKSRALDKALKSKKENIQGLSNDNPENKN